MSGGLKLVSVTIPHADRRAADYIVAFDKSASMAGRKLGLAKQALHFLIDQMTDEDRLAIMLFDTGAVTLLPLQQVTDKGAIKAEIARIEADGAKNISDGLAAALRLAHENPATGKQTKVLLITDGPTDVAIADREKLIDLVSRWAHEGATLSTIGFCDDTDIGLLTDLAFASKGRAHQISREEGIPGVFCSELGGLLDVADTDSCG